MDIKPNLKSHLKSRLICIKNLPTQTEEQIKYYNKCLALFPDKHDLEYKVVKRVIS